MFLFLARYWSSLPLRSKGLLVVGIPVIALLISSAITTDLLRQSQQAERLVRQTLEVQKALRDVRAHVVDAQTSVQGYLLTEQERFLESFTKSIQQFPDVLDRINGLFDDNPVQLERLNRAKAQIEQEFVALETLLSLAEILGPDNPEIVQGFVITSQVVTDGLSAQLEDIQQIQQSLLDTREEEEQRTRRRYLVALIANVCVGLIGSIVGVQLFTWGVTRRIKLLNHNALKLAQGESLDALGPGEDEIAQLGFALEDAQRLLAARQKDINSAHMALQRNVEHLIENNKQITLLNEMGDLLQVSMSVEEAKNIAQSSFSKLFPNTQGSFYLYDKEHQGLERAIYWGAEIPSEEQSGIAIRIPLVAHENNLGLLHVIPEQPLEDLQRQLLGAASDRFAQAIANLQLRETLYEQAIRDPLTGLYNRRYMEGAMEREIYRAERNESPMSIIAFDLDFFKRVNDEHGHDAGDRVLKTFSKLLLSSFRGGDIPCRLGGEEFVVVLPGATLDDSLIRAEYVLQQVRDLEVPLSSTQSSTASLSNLTVSAGIASYPLHGHSATEVLRCADDALYQAKQQGRDRVSICSNSVKGQEQN